MTKRALPAWMLSLLAMVAWAISIHTTTVRPHEPVTTSTPCSVTDIQPLTSEGLAKLLASTGPIEADRNCASVSSCGSRLGCFRVFGGGSQRIRGNQIPACKDNTRDCYDVKCRVTTYVTPDCTGDPLEDSQVDRRGCKKPKPIGTDVGIEPI